jgi:hypothetical protein
MLVIRGAGIPGDDRACHCPAIDFRKKYLGIAQSQELPKIFTTVSSPQRPSKQAASASHSDVHHPKRRDISCALAGTDCYSLPNGAMDVVSIPLHSVKTRLDSVSL